MYQEKSAADRTATAAGPTPQGLSAFWMPFTANRQFKQAPRLLARADGMYFRTPEGREVLDGVAGLWCVNAGHNRPKIVQAIQRQAAELDYAPPFNMAHPLAFELAGKLAQIAPAGLDKVFYHQLGLRIGRDRAQDGDCLPPGARRRIAHPADRPRARLPRRQLRRHLGRRHRRQPAHVRPDAGRGRPHPPHPRCGAQLRSAAGSRSTAPSWPTTSSGWWRCTMRRRSRR